MENSLPQTELEHVVKQAVIDAFKECLPHCPYNLTEAGITPDQHRDHHKKLEVFCKDISKMRLGFVMLVVATLVTGLGTMLWHGFRLALGLHN